MPVGISGDFYIRSLLRGFVVILFPYLYGYFLFLVRYGYGADCG